MDNDTIENHGLLRLIGVMGICIGLAWAVQILVFGGDGSAVVRFLWVMAAACVAGAGAGLIMATSMMQSSKQASARA